MKTKTHKTRTQTKITGLLCLFLAWVCLTGCVTSGVKSLEDVSSQEAITVAKFRIIYNGKDVTKKNCYVYFNNKHSKGFVLKEDGYVFAKLPVGTNSIRTVVHGLLQHHFESSEITFQVDGSGVVNYIGDITFDWHGESYGSVVATMFVNPGFGVIYSMNATGGKTMVAIETNLSAAQAIFGQRFASNKSLSISPLVIKGAVPVKSGSQ